MFGYIKPFKPELKFKEFEDYRSVYCGFCKLLGKSYGSMYRLTLSYDFTFAALLSVSLNETSNKCKTCKCMLHPLKKRKCMDLENCLVLPSAAILLLYYKLLDDNYDKAFIGKTVSKSSLIYMSKAKKKAANLYPDLDKEFENTIKDQEEIEKKDNLNLYEYAQPTAKALGELFTYLSEDDKNKRILKELGFLLGQYVYFADALDDYYDDKSKNQFNPFLQTLDNSLPLCDVFESAISSINMLIGKIISVYELLDIKNHRSVLDNIIYFGLQNTLFVIRKKRLCQKNETECTHE